MEYDGSGSSGNEERRNTRHTRQQIEKLEAYFKECPHPDEARRHMLGKELNMEPDQIKFWFQNKRTQSKAQDERSANILLRGENDRLQTANAAILEALKNVVCPPCGGPPLGKEERERSVQKLRLENIRLKKLREQLTKTLSKSKLKGPTMVDSLASAHRQQIFDTCFSYEANQNILVYRPNSSGPVTSQTVQPEYHIDITQVPEIAASAIEELKRLFSIEEIFWVESSIDGAYMIDRESYENFFHAIRHIKSSSARVESSKEFAVVPIEATNLIEMFLDSEKWKDLFPTIVTAAKTIPMLESDVPIKENCNVVQVIWEKMHILSPLVPPREFVIVRCCQEIEKGLWIIADVTISVNINKDPFSAPCYKRPSGCLIGALPNGQSKVMWIEHVEVDDKSITNHTYREVLFGRSGYGAKRWIATLERMCERMALSSVLTIPSTDWSEDTMIARGRRKVMKLGERVLNLYNEMLTMSGKVEFPQGLNGGIRVSMRMNREEGQPPGYVISAATSISVSLAPMQVFNILTDNDTRHQWDILCHNHPVYEIASFSTGSNEANRVSILKPTLGVDMGSLTMAQNSDKDAMYMIQDCYMDALGGMIVYAPLDRNTLELAVADHIDPFMIPVLPSGFLISNDGRRSTVATDAEDGGGGSLITVVFQILVAGPKSPRPSEKSVDAVSTLISDTVQKVRALLHNNPPHV
ncbi:hypothetical protein AALP_AA3G027000 [Arabis alpina]|uniref:Uncharacterized protein n=1 Tax=Arabis alpina TaxID=50452 RepID=A0A087H6L5_ARAAL|nr:hypothetical protein AALP_AA3G027000 [Arabis alpina]